MCAGQASVRRFWSLALSTRIIQNILVASSCILENIPIWLRLTAFEERERRCRRGLEYICLVGKPSDVICCTLEDITGRACLCLMLSSDQMSSSRSGRRDDSWSSSSVSLMRVWLSSLFTNGCGNRAQGPRGQIPEELIFKSISGPLRPEPKSLGLFLGKLQGACVKVHK